ncbi:MAG: DMT family transporter, partial [Acidimicrobiales bacterium]
AARRSTAKPDRGQWWVIAAAGIALGVHFATWLASLELTSVAASVTLVSTAPIIIAIVQVVGGQRPPARTWWAIAAAFAGTIIIAGSDATAAWPSGASGDRSALFGDGLALIGAISMAFYLMAGDRLRSTLSTAGYASGAYGVAAATSLVVATGSGVELTGYDRRTWLAIAAMVVGPQLLGHTALNHLLAKLGSLTVALALLLEPLGAALLVLVLFGDVPPLGAILGAPLVIAAVALQVVHQPLKIGGAQP